MLIMGTRAAAFTAKVRNLYDYQLRLLHGIVPLPSGMDIANTLKYFSQTLLTVLKDVPSSPLEMLKSREKDTQRLGLFPSLEYKGLYHAATQLLEVAPLIQIGLHAFGMAILQCLGCLMPFLDSEMIDSLPYLVASSLAVLPSTLHQEVINSLCFYILPFTITRGTDEDPSYASQSVAAVIMLVFQHSSSVSYHCQLVECLMALRPGVVRDILCVVAYGTSSARASAARLLFYYWPTFNPILFDRKFVLLQFSSDWTPFVCQRDMCPNSGNAEAAKVCYDHCISITFASDSPPPLYLCIECANEIHREHPNQTFYDILHPMQQVSMVCENKNCRATDKYAYSVCFTTECASYNGNHPIRFCQQCHSSRHNNRRGVDHIVHKSLPQAWDIDAEMQVYLVESIISLLKEAKPGNNDPNKESAEMQAKTSFFSVTPPADNVTLEESQLLGRYGIWLLVGLCTPREDTPPEVLGRLLSMLFHWFYVTAYLYDHQVLSEGTIEKLKTEHVCGWLSDVSKSHFKVFVSCLLPHPPEYSRVGGHWDTLASRTTHLKEGLHRLLCLEPYDVVTGEIWEYVMPRWLEAIVQDVPPRELHELKTLLSKILDPDMGPLGFDAKKMYKFVSVRFKKTVARVQEQALSWLQTLTTLEIVIPLPLLFSMFNDGVKAMRTPVKPKEKGNLLQAEEESRRSSISPVREEDSDNTSPLSDDDAPTSRTHPEFQTDAELDLSCCILMLDLVLKQMELQNADKKLAPDVWSLLQEMLAVLSSTDHDCDRRECALCEARVMWHQLSLELVKCLSPEHTAHPVIIEESSEDGGTKKSPPESDKKGEPKPDVVINMPMPLLEVHTVGGVLVSMPHIMTATVETVAEQLDLAPVVAAERICPAVARQVTISDSDTASATAQIGRATLVGENDQLLEEPEEDAEDFWHTSVGKFRFRINELPAHLQLIHAHLTSLPLSRPSELYHSLQCIYILVLHGDAFTKASKDHRGFFIWCQENLLIKNFWELCNAEQSHICEVVVPLLLHCVTLPQGSDTFWQVVQDDFQNEDWKVRFIAVERVTVIARFMDSVPLKNETILQACLANIFCYLISSMDDVNVQVAQRATLYLGTIHDTALRALVGCLEAQFDSIMLDRPVVLQVLYQLLNCLTDRRVLTWEFFLNRFDTLFIEAQIILERAGELTFVRDLKNSDLSSEKFTKKLHRAQDVLSQATSESSTDSATKTLSASFGPKWPYKRTMSAPASMLPRQETKPDKEKVYSRQYSAPILKRKTSRFGLDGHIHSLVAGDDSSLAGLTKVLNLEGNDHETIHLLIFLLMQFLSRPDQAYPNDEKTLSKSQNIVLRHLHLLLGYSQTENTFHIPPQRLRSSPVFNAYLSNLPQTLDQNHLLAWTVAGSSLAVLLHCPAGRTVTGSSSLPNYTLWMLEPHARRCWLLSLLVILYKYNYNQHPQCAQVNSLVRIVLNTLSAQHHVCRPVPASLIVGSGPTRSREVSQPSLGGDRDEGGEKADSPPPSPMVSDGKTKSYIQKAQAGMMETHWEEPDGRMIHSSVDDDGEGDLSAIPESSWKSDSTLHASPQDTEDDHKVSLMDKVKPSWFLGGDDDKDQGSDDNGRKCGVKQGVMMMVASSFFASSHPVTPKAALYSDMQSQSRTPASGCTERRPSLACAVATAMQPVVATATVVSVPDKPNTPPKTVPPPVVLSAQSRSPVECTSSNNENGMGKDKLEDCWTDKPHGSPIPKSVGRQRHIETTYISSHPMTAPWKIVGASDAKYTIASVNKAVDSEYASYGSPESPLSKMDLITIGSPVEVNSVCSRESCNGTLTQLELPAPERLLPVGTAHDVSSLTDRLRRSLNQDCCSNVTTTEEEPSPDEGSHHDDNSEAHPLHSIMKQASLDKPDAPLGSHSRSLSPRRLIKQVALAESPPDEEPPSFYRSVHNTHSERRHGGGPATNTNTREKTESGGIRSKTDKLPSKTRKKNNSGLFAMSSKTDIPHRQGQSLTTQPLLDPVAQQACHAAFDLRRSSFRVGDDCVLQRCIDCGIPKEEYSDEELGLCIVILGTFIHREPGLAAPLLPDILSIVARLALKTGYPWQREGGPHLPGGAVSVGHQFLRCVLHQLAPNGIFYQMFQTQVEDSIRSKFFRSVAQALLDFNELNPIAPLQLLLETVNTKKSLTPGMVSIMCPNMASYLECLPLEVGPPVPGGPWGPCLTQMELFFRRLVLFLSQLDEIFSVLSIMTSLFKVPGIAACKGILEPFSKVLGYVIQNIQIDPTIVADLCHLCGRAFIREREKFYLIRILVFELVQALKFKTSIPDANFIMLINFIIQDAGGCSFQCGPVASLPDVFLSGTGAADAMRHHLTDAFDFLTDFHTVSKVKSYCQGDTVGLNEDTLGGALKSGVAQYVALEMARGTRDNRTVARHLPWLYNAPTNLQQGSREFLECMGHVRLLSWLLLGGLFQSLSNHVPCTPVPPEASCQVSDHVQVILAGFAEQSKASVLHMSSLFHAFILCQLWTVYLETGASSSPPGTEPHVVHSTILLDFWGKVTPCILQLVAHSKVLAEMVNLHFLSLLEALLEVNAAILGKLMPIWTPVLFAYHTQLPGHLQVRLQSCRNFTPTSPMNKTLLGKWLQRLQFKMGQIELQSSAATQFYSV